MRERVFVTPSFDQVELQLQDVVFCGLSLSSRRRGYTQAELRQQHLCDGSEPDEYVCMTYERCDVQKTRKVARGRVRRRFRRVRRVGNAFGRASAVVLFARGSLSLVHVEVSDLKTTLWLNGGRVGKSVHRVTVAVKVPAKTS